MKKKWKRESITSVADFVRGVSYKKELSCLEAKDGYQAILRANNISDGCVCMEDLVFVPMDMVKSVQKLVVGDVLIAMSSGSKNVVGKAAMIRQQINASFGTFCGVLRPKNGILPPYFGYFFQSSGYRHTISSLAAGVNINNIKLEHFSSIEIPLPPIDEQKRIVAKLDSLLARVESCRAHLDRAAAAIKRFRQSVLNSVVNSCDTPSISQNKTATIEFGSVIKEMRNGLSSKPEEDLSGAKILRISSVRQGKIDFDDYRHLITDKQILDSYSVKNGDLLFTRYNGTLDYVGVCAMVKNCPDIYVYPDKLIRVRVATERILPEYAEIIFGTTLIRKQIEELVKSSAGQKGISGADLRMVKIPLPSLESQKKLIKRIAKICDLLTLLESRCSQISSVATNLYSSILAKAFRGELV